MVIQLKLNVVSVYYEGIEGSRSIDPHILNLGTRWEWVVSFTCRPLYASQNFPQYPLHSKIGGFSSRSGRSWVEKERITLLWIQPRAGCRLFAIVAAVLLVRNRPIHSQSIFSKQQNSLILNTTDHKTHLISCVNSYTFRHQGAIIKTFINSKGS